MENDNQITYDGFTWNRIESTRDETWALAIPDEAAYLVARLWLVNYGGQPGHGFAGWKLVTGGPIDAAGSYDRLSAAICGVTPWMRRYLQSEACVKLERAERAAETLRAYLELIRE